jgi:hypothetical protein
MIEVDTIRWGVNKRWATCRHVLGADGLPVCGQARGEFRDLLNITREDERLQQLPICARCKPIARMRGIKV